MKTIKPTKAEVGAMFESGLNCSQCVLGQLADELGYDTEELHRIAHSFGGGMFRGDTCGTVVGALLAIGMAYGGSCDEECDEAVHEKVHDFIEKFTARFGSIYCRELLGYDFSVPGEKEKAFAAGATIERCPDFVRGSLEILEEITEK